MGELTKFEGKYLIVEGSIKNILDKSDNYSKYTMVVTGVKHKNEFYRVNEKTLLRVNGNKTFAIGDKLNLYGIVAIPNSNSNPKLFSYRLYLNTEKIYTIVTTKDYLIKVVSKGNLTIYEKTALAFRARVAEVFDRYTNKNSSHIIKSIILGESSYLEDEYEEKMRNLGLAHILAVSGLHIGIISLFLAYTFKIIGISKKISSPIVILLLWCYGYFIGYPSSVLRALIMFSSLMLADLTYRRYDSVNSLAFGCLILLIYNPLWLFSVGFQLSFVATLSIILFTPKINEVLSIIGKIRNMLSPILAVQIGVIPIFAYHFNEFSIISVISNLVIIPIMSLSVVISFLLIAVTFVSKQIPFIIGKIIDLLMFISSFLMNIINKAPVVSLKVISPTFSEIIGYIVLVLLLLKFIRLNKISSYTRKALFVYLLFTILTLGVIQPGKREAKIEFLDVGQGDACLISLDNKVFLVDTGGSTYSSFDIGSRILVPYLLKNKINRINGVFITHFHEDHCEGLLSLIDDIKIEYIAIGYEPKNNELYKKIVEKAEKHKIPIIVLKKGDSISIGNNAHFSVLWPYFQPQEDYERSDNNLSLVLLLRVYNKGILFTGDIERNTEENIIKYNDKYDIDVLKVPHHGSGTSSSLAFITHFTPDYGVISLGKNNFGHPDNEVIKRYNSKGVKLYRTDKQGLITILLTPNQFTIYPYNDSKSLLVNIINNNIVEMLIFISYIAVGLWFMKSYINYLKYAGNYLGG
jgi:competence protein ComEC